MKKKKTKEKAHANTTTNTDRKKTSEQANKTKIIRTPQSRKEVLEERKSALQVRSTQLQRYDPEACQRNSSELPSAPKT